MKNRLKQWTHKVARREDEGKGGSSTYRPFSRGNPPKLLLDHFRFWKYEEGLEIANHVTRILLT